MSNETKTNLTIQVDALLMRRFKAVCALKGSSLTKQITNIIQKICDESIATDTIHETPEELCAIITKNGMKHEKH